MKFTRTFLTAILRYCSSKLSFVSRRCSNYCKIPGLQSSVTVKLDRFGIPSIFACSKVDAMRAMGHVTARDRLFQMDIFRRTAAGRLSEIMGRDTLEMDSTQRSIGLHKVAEEVVARLPTDQRQVLEAYADGVNAYIAGMIIPPVEFLMLRYWPEPWRAEDCILVGLYMMQEISGVGEEENERMMTIMSKTLPAEVFSFLTPDEDCYSTVLLGGVEARRPVRQVPVQALASIFEVGKQVQCQSSHLAQRGEELRGSNAWVVGKCKTSDGRAILANDMHLPLSTPNIWYRALLHYGDVRITGIMVPGLPVIIAGSNGHVAWGSTNINGDFLDLVELEINPYNPDEYKTSSGWRPFETVHETIQIKGSRDEAVQVKKTIWGPVSPYPLLGRQVAIHWTGLDPDAVDIGWTHMDRAQTVEEAINIVRECGGAPLNVMLADSAGRIGWTLSGKVPIRKGLDGSVSKSWVRGHIGWKGYIPPDQIPVVIDPPTGFLVTANHRTVGKQYPYVIGHHFANGFRAHYINEQLQAYKEVDEQGFFALQHDTSGKFYEFYRSLALDLLREYEISGTTLLSEARMEIEMWDGKADLDSRGIGILVRFREALACDIFGPYLKLCKEADGNFKFRHNFEDPLRKMINEKHPKTLPDPDHHLDWRSFLISTLAKSVQQLKDDYQVESLDQLTWAQLNFTEISHLLSRAIPHLGKILDMPRKSLPGCVFCVRVADSQHGASMRMVVSPGHEEDGTLHMPGGQSGRPLSKNYKDQHSYWALARPIPFLPGETVQEWVLHPSARREVQSWHAF